MENTVKKIEIYHKGWKDSVYLSHVLYTAKDIDFVKDKIIPDLINERHFRINLYCIYVSEIKLDELGLEDTFEHKWMFLNDGTLWAECNYSKSINDCTFKGRKPEELRFKKGDKVDYVCGGEIVHGFIYELPVKYDERMNWCDDYDDSYICMEGELREISNEDYMELHDHILVDRVFPRDYTKDEEEEE